MARTGQARRSKREVIELGEGDWYELPSWYDILHGAGTAAEVDGLERIAERYVRGSRGGGRGGRGGRGRRGGLRWLEPACGSGRFLRVIAGRGGVAHGFDRSEAMVTYARRSLDRRGLRGRVWVADMERFALPGAGSGGGAGGGAGGGGGGRVDVAFNLINTVRHLTTDAGVRAHLSCVARSLRRGGIYALGLNLTAYGAESESEDVWVGRRGSCEVTQVVQYLPAERRRRRERVINHLTVITPRTEKHLDNTYDLRSFSGPQWARVLGGSAMEAVAVVDEVGCELGPVRDWVAEGVSGYGIWVLRAR